MSIDDNPVFNATATNASAIIKASPGNFGRIFVSGATGATITVYDGTDATGTVKVASFTPAASTGYDLPFKFYTGCFIAVTGTITYTAFWA